MDMTRVSVPGKIILAGEHSVVYGYPALVAAVDKRLTVRSRFLKEGQIVIKDKYKNLGLARFAVKECLKELKGEYGGVKLKIVSDLPATGGMGSSAAMATGVVWSMLKDKDQVVKDKAVKKVEDRQHGKSSGVDQTIVREGGVIKFRKGKIFKVRNFKCEGDFLLIDSGRPVESTGEMVKKVSLGNYSSEFNRMGEIVKDWRVELIQENQRLLEKIGVVGKRAKRMIRKIEGIGGAAKVCGAGGVKQGSGVILAVHDKIERLKQLAGDNKWQWFQVNLGAEGVRYEKN